MRALFAIGAFLLVAAGGASQAADKPQYGPPGAWVKSLPMPVAGTDVDGASQVLLQNEQTAFGLQEDSFFHEKAIKIQSARGLADSGNIIIPWRPDTETIVIHRLTIIRGEQSIDLLAGGKTFTVLRRETNLERAMLDGTLTATFQPDGLQVGDIIDLAYTRVMRDPVLKGRSEDWNYLVRPGVAQRAYFRMTWPKSKPLRWKVAEGLSQPSVTQTAQGGELVVDMPKAEAPQPPRGAPLRFADLANLQASDFSSWAAVSALMEPLYAKASVLAADSPLRAEIAKIKASSADPKAQAAAALALVEDKVRYLFLGLNNGGYIPADADVTWTRRFGDCKAKTALLLALLKGLGIEAQPALVSTTMGDGMDQRLPGLDRFDHVAVLATIGGKPFWLDGTRIGDTDLDSLPKPDFRWMLPVQAAGADLKPLRPDPYAEPHVDTRMQLDASAGMDAPAPVHVEQIFRGDEGLGLRLSLEAMTHADLDRAMRAYWSKTEPWIEAKQVAFLHRGKDVVLTLDGVAMLDWSKDGDSRDLLITDSNIGVNTSFQREPGPNHDAPFAVQYPAYLRRTITVSLPNKGQGFLLMNGAPISQVVAGAEYRRSTTLDNGVASIELTVRSLAAEFPYAEASADAATLRNWALHSVELRLNPAMAQTHMQELTCLKAGPDAAQACAQLISRSGADRQLAGSGHYGLVQLAFRNHDWPTVIAQANLALEARPDLAIAYNDRGAAYAQQGRLDLALPDYDQAIRLQPSVALFWRNRGAARQGLGKFKDAADDLSRAIELDPKDPAVLVRRGWVYGQLKDWDRAFADLSRAAALDPKLIDVHTVRAEVYSLKGQIGPAIADLDAAIALQPRSGAALAMRSALRQARGEWGPAIADLDLAVAGDPQNAQWLNARCWARATANRELELALGDCNAALAAAPPAVRIGALGSRGLVYVRMKALDKALADYQEVLRLQPNQAAALYMRGLILRQTGEAARGEADIAQAKALQPQIAAVYARMGLSVGSPPVAGARVGSAAVVGPVVAALSQPRKAAADPVQTAQPPAEVRP